MSSAGILNLPITSLPVDNFHDRALWCKSTGLNYNMHGWILCRYCATGWFWWISGLRAVTMWSSSSFTKTDNTEQYHNKNWSFALTWRRTPFNPPFRNASFQLLSTEAYIRHWLLRYYLDLVKIIARYEMIIAWYEIVKTWYAIIITLYVI